MIYHREIKRNNRWPGAHKKSRQSREPPSFDAGSSAGGAPSATRLPPPRRALTCATANAGRHADPGPPPARALLHCVTDGHRDPQGRPPTCPRLPSAFASRRKRARDLGTLVPVVLRTGSTWPGTRSNQPFGITGLSRGAGRRCRLRRTRWLMAPQRATRACAGAAAGFIAGRSCRAGLRLRARDRWHGR